MSSRHLEWLRDLEAAEAELEEATTERQVKALQWRIRWIKYYMRLS